MQALIEKKYDGRDLKLGRQIGETNAYKRYLISYRGDKERISGVMRCPTARARSRCWCSTTATSTPTPTSPARASPESTTSWPAAVSSCCTPTTADTPPRPTTRTSTTSSGCRYVVDTINAVKAVKTSKLKFLDRGRVGWLGRSMGGGVTLTALAVRPGLVDAGVVYASVSSLAADNWKQFNRDAEDQATNRRIARRLRVAGREPEVLAGRVRPALPRPGDRAGHGPPRTAGRHLPGRLGPGHRADLKADKDVTYLSYRGEGHTFEGRVGARSSARPTSSREEHLDCQPAAERGVHLIQSPGRRAQTVERIHLPRQPFERHSYAENSSAVASATA